MASLTDTNINETYCSLIKTNDNNTVTGLSRLSDGLGNNISLSVNTSNNGICVHGNLTFDTFCNYTFPSDTGQTGKVLTVNNDVIGLGNANDSLDAINTFTDGALLSTIKAPSNLTFNNKGLVTGVCDIYNGKQFPYCFVYGQARASSFTNIINQWDDSANCIDIFPPSGYTMDDVVAVMPSIGQIHFAGGVNYDDKMRTVVNYCADRVRIFTQNSEQRAAPGANYLVIFKNYDDTTTSCRIITTGKDVCP
jgi:hypothetical protein